MKVIWTILDMDVEKVDLNLMRVFDALIEDGNLTLAGFRLGLSQPAMSHALARLRKLTGDVLFVRIPTGMKPTEHALRMAPLVREGLRLLDGSLEDGIAFDPRSSDRTFGLLLSDIGEAVYLPRLQQRLQGIAPAVNVRVLQLPRESYLDAFLSGEADLAIGFLPGLKAGFYQQRLFSDTFGCLVRRRHPRIGEFLSLEQFLNESHVLVEPGGSRYMTATHQTSTTTLIEQYFTEHGLARRVALRVPHFLAVPDIVQFTDLIATVPSYVVRATRPQPELKLLPLPLEAPRIEIRQFWHQRNNDDAGNRWLRGVIAHLFKQD
jgi:DNA-binding transcriptional LysR family regulator